MPKSEITFLNPPIKEVSYSAQFEPVKGFHMGFKGLLWGEYREQYPLVEHNEPLDHEIERFGAVTRNIHRPKFKLVEGIPHPRVMMLSEDQNRLIQVQSDRFIFNWRKYSSDDLEYPRYVSLRDEFRDELDKFESFVVKNGLVKSLEFNQVEITNVNHIPTENKQISDVILGMDDGKDLSASLKAESFGSQMKHLICQGSEPIGRLYTNIEKANMISDGTEVFVLRFLARAHPRKRSKDGLFEMMDILRGHINQSFDALTTENMHKIWKKKESL